MFIYSLQYFVINCLYFLFSNKKKVKTVGEYNGGISIIIPSYDEVLTIYACISSIINSSRNYEMEIIVVDDGNEHATLDCLADKFKFKCESNYKQIADDKQVRGVYLADYEVPIFVIDKENEGKSKALNTALKLCNYDYFVCLDADTIVDRNAIANIYDLLNDDVVAIGGKIIPIDNEYGYIEKMLYHYQKWEYFINFSFSRVAYDRIGCVPILSGAFSVINKNVALEIGGYSGDTLGEDFDITLKLHENCKNNNSKILYCDNAIAYTQVPFDLMSFFKQRIRWQTGMLQVLRKHKKLMYEFTVLAYLLRIMKFYESFFAVIELILICLSIKKYLICEIIALLSSTILVIVLKVLNKNNERFYLLLSAVTNILFHSMYILIRIVAFIRTYIFNDSNIWKSATRKSN